MDLSVFVAQTLALAYLSVGLGMLVSDGFYSKFIKKVYDDSSYLVLAGFISLIIGMLLVEFHGEWTNDWRSLITLVAWAALFKGVFILVFPAKLKVFKSMFKETQLSGMGVVILGLVFAYFGFVA